MARAEVLAFYFAAQDRRALALLYAEAAQDPQFKADNDAVQTDFAVLDFQWKRPRRAREGSRARRSSSVHASPATKSDAGNFRRRSSSR